MKMNTRLFITYLALAILLSAGIAPTRTFGAEPKKVSLGFPAVSGGFLPFYIAQEEGYYKQEGLDPQIQMIRGAISVRTLISNTLDYNTAPALDAIVRTRQPIRYLLSMTHGKYVLVSNPAVVKTITDLKGKSLAVSSFGGSADLVSRRILKSHGLQPDKDVALLQIGTPRDRFLALSAGRIGATLLTSPDDLQALDQGMISLEKFIDIYPQIGINVMQSRIETKPDEVYGMVKATFKGLRYEVERKEDAITKMMKSLKLDNRDFTRRVYASFEEVLIPEGYLPDAEKKDALETTRKEAGVSEEIPIAQAFDDRFVKRALEELKKTGWKP